MSGANLGIPIRLIHESLGHVITVETKGGVSYRGQLYEGEQEITIYFDPVFFLGPY